MHSDQDRPGAPPSSEPSAGQLGGAAGSVWQRASADIASGARIVTPVVRSLAARIGDWLANIGWGKFFLLAILSLMVGAIADKMFFSGSPAVVIERGTSAPKVEVEISVADDGIHIGAPAKPTTPPTPAPPPAPTAPVTESAATPAADTPATKPTAPDLSGRGAGQVSAPPERQPSVEVNERGVHVVTQKDGREVAVTIDDRGVQVQERKPGAAVADKRSDTVVVVPLEATGDAKKLSAALEAVRSEVEDVVNEQVKAFEENSARERREPDGDWLTPFVTMLILSAVIVKVAMGSKRRAEVRAQAATATAVEEGLKRQLAEAHLKMMQAQVEPHFLFNTLASVDFLIETDPARASVMQKNLIQYLRAALPQMREGSTTLGKEIALCRAYLEILKVRMDERLQFTLTIPQGLASAQFPPMMLQSLVENAIKHGLEPKPEGGTMTISADVSHGSLRVRVADTGLGFGSAGVGGTGVGLTNVHERLAALYGGRAKLTVEGNSPVGTIVTIEVPYEVDLAGTSAAAGTFAPVAPA